MHHVKAFSEDQLLPETLFFILLLRYPAPARSRRRFILIKQQAHQRLPGQECHQAETDEQGRDQIVLNRAEQPGLAHQLDQKTVQQIDRHGIRADMGKEGKSFLRYAAQEKGQPEQRRADGKQTEMPAVMSRFIRYRSVQPGVFDLIHMFRYHKDQQTNHGPQKQDERRTPCPPQTQEGVLQSSFCPTIQDITPSRK